MGRTKDCSDHFEELDNRTTATGNDRGREDDKTTGT